MTKKDADRYMFLISAITFVASSSIVASLFYTLMDERTPEKNDFLHKTAFITSGVVGSLASVGMFKLGTKLMNSLKFEDPEQQLTINYNL